MGIIILLISVLPMLWVGEAFILIWFMVRVSDLRRGTTDFKISVKIPILYMVITILSGLVIMILDKGIMVEGEIPFATRLFNATRLFLLTNLTTPLFPLLAWLKHRKIKSAQVGSLKSTPEVNS